MLDRIDEDRLKGVREARTAAWSRAWAAGAAPAPGSELRLDFDATITIAHSEKESAAPTWKRTFGFHPLLCFLDRPEVAGGETLAGVLRPGNAGSNTACDHITVLDLALAQLPAGFRPRPGDPDSPRVLTRSDSAGATHKFADACVARGVEFSFGFPIDVRIRRIVDLIPDQCWSPAIQTDDDLRDGAWVFEATGMIDLRGWPAGSRLILRKERPHPGADVNRPRRAPDRRGADQHTRRGDPRAGRRLELRHRQHASVEDRIREAKATGLRNLPCHAEALNAAWLEVVLTAVDLVTWTQLIGFADVPVLGRCEIQTLRYRVLHVAARITRGARRTHPRLDQRWRWAVEIAAGFHLIRAAFA